MDRKDLYQGEMERKMAELGAKMDEMQAKAELATADKRAEMNRHLEEINARRTDAQKRLDEIKASSDSAFETVQAGFQAAWEDLSQSFAEASKKFQ
ncbi:MAG: hypothetical protein ACFB8W_07720 [Elainellaceae cyanobacterium]